MGVKNSGKRFRRAFISFFIIVILAGLVIWIFYKWPDPPLKDLKEANDALIAARAADAEKYAPQLFSNTNRLYEATMRNWRTENQRFFLNRDFSITRAFALQAIQIGREAEKQALTKSHTIRQNTGTTLSELNNIKKDFERMYYALPLPKTVRENFHKAVFLMTEARLARDRSDLKLAESKLEKAKYLMEGSARNAQSMLEGYFSALPKWRRDVKWAVDQSASQNAPLIVVKKMDHECLLYMGGKIKSRFNAEFGPNWIGDKNYRGDGATPEGIYRITHKKDQRRTIYHKSLSINYPNDEDRARFRNNVASGIYSRRHNIGGSIEIHGNGGKGFDWTKGCVALTDKDIDTIFSLVPENTPVVIVGSLDPLEKYLN